MIKIIAVLCSLASPTNCHEQTVTTSELADVSMQSCLMGAPQLAAWMSQHPAERLAAWRCVIGKQDGRGARLSFPANSIDVVRPALRSRAIAANLNEQLTSPRL